MLKQSILAIAIATAPLMTYADMGQVKGSCGPNQVANSAYLERIVENLENRVNAGVKDGSLVAEEPSRLSSRISELRTSYGHINKNGKWAVAEGRCDIVEGEFKKLSSNIFKQRHDKEGNVARAGMVKRACGTDQVANSEYLESIVENLETRVNAGVKDGSLVAEEPSRLSSRISELRTSYGHINKNGKWAVAEGRCDIVEDEFKKLSSNISKQRHDKEGNVAGSKKAKEQAAEQKH